jgi:hypothetical protein
MTISPDAPLAGGNNAGWRREGWKLTLLVSVYEMIG